MAVACKPQAKRQALAYVCICDDIFLWIYVLGDLSVSISGREHVCMRRQITCCALTVHCFHVMCQSARTSKQAGEANGVIDVMSRLGLPRGIRPGLGPYNIIYTYCCWPIVVLLLFLFSLRAGLVRGTRGWTTLGCCAPVSVAALFSLRGVSCLTQRGAPT